MAPSPLNRAEGFLHGACEVLIQPKGAAMATVLAVGDIALIHYNSTGTDAFSFVFLRAVEAGTSVNFTDDGWQALGGFRPGEGTVTYTAPAAIAPVRSLL
jgi:hypothetical protein